MLTVIFTQTCEQRVFILYLYLHRTLNCLTTKKSWHPFFRGTDVPQTYHSAVGHGALGSAGTLGALPPLLVSAWRLADLEDVPGGSGAVFAPIRCRTHAYTSTIKTTPKQKDFVRSQPQILVIIKTKQTKRNSAAALLPPCTLYHSPYFIPFLYTQFTFSCRNPTYSYCSVSLPLLIVGEGEKKSQTSLRAQKEYRESACGSSPHCLHCVGAQVTFTPALLERCTARTLHTPAVLTDVSFLTHRCQIAFTDGLQMQPFFMIARFHQATEKCICADIRSRSLHLKLVCRRKSETDPWRQSFCRL